MLKLAKYEIRKSLYPFIVLMFLNVIWWIFNMLNFNENINKILQFILEIGMFIIIIYSIKEINEEFDEEKSTLGFQLPVKGWKRFLVKYSMYCVAYSIIVILNVIAALYNKEHIHSIMYNQIVNGNLYISYSVLSRIMAYISGMMVVAFVIMFGKYITERLGLQSIQAIVSILMFVGVIIFILFMITKISGDFSSLYEQYSLKLTLKPGLSRIEYTVSTYILFLPSISSGSTSHVSLMPSINMFPIIVNSILTIILVPFVLKLLDRK